jgi:hypothetical protein
METIDPESINRLKEELAYVTLQRDKLLEITWLDGPSEPWESTSKWKEQFDDGWIRRSERETSVGKRVSKSLKEASAWDFVRRMKEDWTVEDWEDFYNGIKSAMERIAARHR